MNSPDNLPTQESMRAGLKVRRFRAPGKAKRWHKGPWPTGIRRGQITKSTKERAA